MATDLASKRIVFVFEFLELGGAERQGLLLARHLKNAEGAEIHVVGLGMPGRAAELCEEHGIPWSILDCRWPSHGLIGKVPALLRFTHGLRSLRPDVVLPYTMLPNVLCGVVWRMTGARTCIWNQRDEGRGRMGRRLERLAVRGTPAYISNSRHGAGFLINDLGVPENRVSVIYNGVETEAARTDGSRWRRDLQLDDKVFAACMVANLHSCKDHAPLLRAWRTVADRLSAEKRSAVLLLAGRPAGNQDALKALAYDLELGKSVRFLGQVRDVAGLLAAADCGVFSSKLEGVPNAVLECMAAGLPVVGTDIPGIREAVGPEGLPWLAPPGDPDTLAKLVLRLASSPKLRAELGRDNRARVEKEFSPALMCQKMTAIIEGAIHNKGRLPKARVQPVG